MLVLVYYWLLTLPFIDLYSPVAKVQIHLYGSDRVSSEDLNHDCLLYNGAHSYPSNKSTTTTVNRPYQIIPYCIRGFHTDAVIQGIPITFQALMDGNVNSDMLYLSSVPIDTVERYEAFLENPHAASSKQQVYNCSMPWFGEFCQYRLPSMKSFEEIVRSYFNALRDPRPPLDPVGYITCYTFMKCDRGPWPSCLDWREICDGKIDCLNGGVDEIGCDDLDTNECDANDYRCANGLCIPSEFFNDDLYNPDCMDTSDEKYNYDLVDYSQECHFDPTFRCEERACQDHRQDTCGDGQCRRGTCKNRRDTLLSQAKLSWDANRHLPYECWMSLICLTVTPDSSLSLPNLTTKCPPPQRSVSIGTILCPEYFFFPAQPIVLSHVRLLYERNVSFQFNIYSGRPFPSYACYDQHLCESLRPTMQFNESSCLHFSEIQTWAWDTQWYYLERAVVNYFARCLLTEKSYAACPNSKPFRCANSSKCLSLNRLMDGVIDCIAGDDENVAHSCLLPDQRFRFKCFSDDVCIDIKALNYTAHMCKPSDEWTGEIFNIDTSGDVIYPISFATMCNGFVDHKTSNPFSYTDETDCHLWPCNNVYTRCDEQGTWNCLNGADEADCPGNPCRPHGHPCLSLENNRFTCLPLSRINDGVVDCLGAYDERAHCRTSIENPLPSYQCFNGTKCISLMSVCHPFLECPAFEDNGDWCKTIGVAVHYPCNPNDIPQTIEHWSFRNYLCSLRIESLHRKLKYYTLTNHVAYPDRNRPMIRSFTASIPQEAGSKNELISAVIGQSTDQPVDIFCKRGILVYANDFIERYCLCPPAYFGHRCEYRSDRVSLTIQFRTIEWSTLFNLVVMLVDNITTIHSFEQFGYLAVRDCRKKFNLNLLYLNRSKSAHHTYYVRIDVYDMGGSKHVSSLFYPVQFLFLPVYRLSRQVNIARPDSSMKARDCPLDCVHGQCIRYDNRNEYFCRCFDGYSGELCSVRNECNCSPHSICVGTANNRSICVCLLDRFGPRCYLKRTACIPNPCRAGGQCVPTDVRISEWGYFCICRSGFTGSNCEQLESRIEFCFAKNIVVPQSMLIHFIDITPRQTDERIRVIDLIQTTPITKIQFDQAFAVVHHGGVFHLVFLQMNRDYYLALLQHNHTSSINVSTQVIPENRCAPISDFPEPRIRNDSAWYRARFYHVICKEQAALQCFHDNDRFMCLCDVERFANCFKFDFKRTYNCFGNNYCENNGECYQDHNTCPSSSSCFCDECFYGTRCQFTSVGYGLSLDDILGYSIWPRISFVRQPTIVHASTAITLMMFVLSVINGILSIVTFRTTKSLAVGSGVYLLSVSVASCLTIFLFVLKFLLLIFSHISSTMNRNFLVFNCTIMDMFLKSFLAMVDWLYTCVAIERVWTIYKECVLYKKQSVNMAKRVTPAICLFTLGSYIHDAIFRRLIEDAEEQRTWCIVRYSPAMKVVSTAINLIHFLVPLSINLVSVVAIIILLARQKSKVAGRSDQRKHLWTQFRQHKHYLLSSIVLIVIAMPRLVISFTSKCMTSARHPWLYLTAYFFSFVSPLLIFVFFVLPSEFYRKQFAEETLRLRKTVQRRFGKQ